VRDLAERILSEYDRLDVLVNNAGIIVQERKKSEDGYELTFAVNYLSHFLLTSLLLPLLKDSAPARVVNVASAGQSPIDFDVRGITRVFELEVDDAGWSMIRLDEDFSQRSTARFRGPDAMESTGEVSHDNGVTWQPDFTMTYQRVE
jgi:hypothetical protein